MQIQETFTVDAPPATVWRFFEEDLPIRAEKVYRALRR
jgi:carbon monoxide dehydrogenase subunit G